METKLTPKDFFLHLGAIIGLYITAISFLVLLYQIINLYVPDQLENFYYRDPYSGALRFAISTLIIVFPLMLILWKLVEKEYRKNSEKLELGFRKWLIFITLFVAGIALAGDAIVVVNQFLDGEIGRAHV